MPELPAWFTQPLPDGLAMGRMRAVLKTRCLHTVCESARCPNTARCWARGAVTFMILGDACTRACGFCAVTHAVPSVVDEGEPERIAEAVRDLGAKYVVITSVTRDDIPDGGAGHFARTVRAVRAVNDEIRVEVLVPDFKAQQGSFNAVAAADPRVIGHNIETVRRISRALRPQADHDRSLEALRMARQAPGRHFVKSGLMAGLGETDDEVLETLRELKKSDCDIVTIGQYLAPAGDGRQVPVRRFVEPQTFDMYRREALAMGFRQVFSGPLVRSSFMADEVFDNALEGA